MKALEIYRKYNGSATKKLGQNYIFSEDINSRIVSFAGDLSDKNVLEIGPGPGGLTTKIIEQNPKSLTLVELDTTWGAAWQDIAKDYPNIHVVNNDILKVEVSSSIDVVVSNLPYNVASQILIKLLPEFWRRQKLVLMFQKEMADRICAAYNTKDYGRLSVLAQERAKIKKELVLSPNCFTPAPKVYSTVLSFSPYSEAQTTDFGKLNKLVTVAFANRRKQVIKALTSVYGEAIKTLFNELEIRPDARAEQITVVQYVELCKRLG